MKFIKICAIILSSLLGFLLLFIFMLPFALSTKSGQKQLENSLSYALHATVKIEHLSLSWVEEQNIQNLTIASPEFNFSSTSIESSDSLLKFIFNGCRFKHLEIKKPKLNITHLSKENKNTKIQAPLAAFLIAKHLHLSSGSFSLQTSDKKLLQFKDIDLDLEIKEEKPLIELQFSTQTFFEKENGKIDLSLAFSPSHLLKVNASIIDLSMPAIDALLISFGQINRPLLTQSFGEAMNIKLHLDSTSSEIESYIKSKFLNLHLNTQNHTSPPLVFDWTISPAILELFGLHVKNSLHLSSAVQTLDIPSLFDWKKTAIKMKTTLFDLTLNDMKISRLECNLDSQNLSEMLTLAAYTQFASPALSGDIQGLLTIKDLFGQKELSFKAGTNALTLMEPLTGIKRNISLFSCELPAQTSGQSQKKLNIDIKLDDTDTKSLFGNAFESHFSTFLFTSKKTFSLKDFDLSLTSELLKGSFQGSYDFSSNALKLSKDGYIDYKIAPPLFVMLASKWGMQDLKLDKETLVTFLLEKNSSTKRLNAHIFSEDCTLTSLSKSIDLHNIDAELELKTEDNTLDTKAKLTLMKEGFVNAAIHTNLSTQESTLKIQGKKILVEPLKSLSPSLPYIVGDECDIEFLLKTAPHNVRHLEFDLSSAFLKIKGGMNLNEKSQIIAITNPVKIDFNLTPSSYNALSRLSQEHISKETFDLRETAVLSATVSKWRMDESQGFASLEFKGLASLKNFAISRQNNWLATADLSLQMEKKRLEAAKGNILSMVASESGRSDVTGNFEILNFDINDPLLDALSKMHLSLDLNIIKLPTILIDALLQPFINFQMATYLGDALNAKVKVESEKELKKLLLEMDSSSSTFYLNGSIAERRLFLNVPMTASIELSTALTNELYDAFGISIAKSSVPISLEISSHGFIMPLTPSALTTADANFISLDLGKMVAINKGTLDGVNSLFKTKAEHTLPIWFAPFEMRLKNGLLSLDRTEILLDNKYHICMWGKIDLAKKWVKLTIGLTAQSLKKALGIPNLPDSYVLQVPLEGPFGNVELKKGAVTSKIVLLIGSVQAPNNLFEGITKAFNSIMNDQSNVPKPKRPYPWEKQMALREIEIQPIELKRSKPKAEELIHF